jgi:hypothetical protein
MYSKFLIYPLEKNTKTDSNPLWDRFFYLIYVNAHNPGNQHHEMPIVQYGSAGVRMKTINRIIYPIKTK